MLVAIVDNIKLIRLSCVVAIDLLLHVLKIVVHLCCILFKLLAELLLRLCRARGMRSVGLWSHIRRAYVMCLPFNLKRYRLERILSADLNVLRIL